MFFFLIVIYYSFGPNLLRNKEDDLDTLLQHTGYINAITEILISNNQKLYMPKQIPPTPPIPSPPLLGDAASNRAPDVATPRPIPTLPTNRHRPTYYSPPVPLSSSPATAFKTATPLPTASHLPRTASVSGVLMRAIHEVKGEERRPEEDRRVRESIQLTLDL